MSRLQNLLTTTGLLGVVCCPLPAFAQLEMAEPEPDDALIIDLGPLAAMPPAHGGPGLLGPQGHGQASGLYESLTGEQALSDEQYEKMFELRRQFMNEVGSRQATLRSLERDLQDQLMKSQIDHDKIKALQGKINVLKNELANLRLDSRVNALEILTVEQRQELRKQMVKGGMGCFRESRVQKQFRMREGHHH